MAGVCVCVGLCMCVYVCVQGGKGVRRYVRMCVCVCVCGGSICMREDQRFQIYWAGVTGICKLPYIRAVNLYAGKSESTKSSLQPLKLEILMPNKFWKCSAFLATREIHMWPKRTGLHIQLVTELANVVSIIHVGLVLTVERMQVGWTRENSWDQAPSHRNGIPAKRHWVAMA